MQSALLRRAGVWRVTVPGAVPRCWFKGGGSGESSFNISEGSPDAHRIHGFNKDAIIVDAARHTGPLLLAGQKALVWRVAGIQDVTPAALAVFAAIKPKVEILVVGTGKSTLRAPPAVVAFCAQHDIALEATDTRRACATYNFLNEEGRVVGAALMPVAWTPVPAAS